MAKTVFGMPGAGEKSKGGDAVAPGGAPGAKSSAGLPQKSGKEPQQAEEKQGTIKQAAMAKPEEPAKKPSKAPMAVPSTAKPVTPKPAGGKTMFGMPAMKLPVKPAEPAQPQSARGATQPVAAQPAQPQGRTTPVGLQVPDTEPVAAKGGTVEAPAMTEDAYKATVVGVGAVTPSKIPPTEERGQPAQTAPQQAYEAASPQPKEDEARVKTMVAAQAAAPARTAPTQGGSGQNIEEWRQAAKKPPIGMILIFLAIIVVLTGVAAYLFFGSINP